MSLRSKNGWPKVLKNDVIINVLFKSNFSSVQSDWLP